MEVKPEDSQKRSDYLLLIQARLYGQPGTNADRANRLELSEKTISDLMKGKAESFSLSQLKAIARKAGVTARI
jgi:predicted XRE-type DNA-binding protein